MSDTGLRPVGLAGLSLLGAAPWEIVEHAAAAGFSFVGIRVLPVTTTETFHTVAPGSPNARRTLDALKATGLEVRDVEFLLLDGVVGREQWLPALEAGAALGASTFTVAGADTDRGRLVDSLQAFTDDARPLGITPALEAISYQAVRTLPQAAELAAEVGCLVLPDSLHHRRVEGTVADARVAAPLSQMVQLCDALVPAPDTRDGLLHESRANRGIPGQGDANLVGFLGAFSETMPVSVEVPNPLREQVGDAEYAAVLRHAVQQLVLR